VQLRSRLWQMTLPTATRYFREFVDDQPNEVSFLEQLAAVLILNGILQQKSFSNAQNRKTESIESLYPVMANLYEELNLPARAEFTVFWRFTHPLIQRLWIISA